VTNVQPLAFLSYQAKIASRLLIISDLCLAVLPTLSGIDCRHDLLFIQFLWNAINDDASSTIAWQLILI